MSEDLRGRLERLEGELRAMDRQVATLQERMAGTISLVQDLEKKKVDRTEFSPIQWAVRIVGSAVFLALVGGFMRLVLK